MAKREQIATLDRQDSAMALADGLMETHGYQPCRDKFQPKRDPELGAVARLYTMDRRGGTNHGGVSIGFSKTDLASSQWEKYVAAQVKFAIEKNYQ